MTRDRRPFARIFMGIDHWGHPFAFSNLPTHWTRVDVSPVFRAMWWQRCSFNPFPPLRIGGGA